MRVFLLLLTFLGVALVVSAQDQPTYFPQEQLVHPDCEGDEDSSKCLYGIFDKQIRTLVKNYVQADTITKVVDTLEANMRFSVDETGLIEMGFKYITFKNKDLNDSAKLDLNLIFSRMPKFEVLHKKPEKYNPFHLMNFRYELLKQGDSLQVNSLGSDDIYQGGYIQEFPEFPGCEGLSGREVRMCFNKGIQEHIKNNFRYPKKARKQKIQGKVNIIFWINEKGEVADIRTRGPHPVLEEEAIRIIKLMPRCKPGLLNGEPTKTPFSIPLGFRL